MDLQHVKAFLMLAEELHFGRAAERLHMAQPPLTRTIQQLERHLGTALFERTTRRVELTPAGQALLAPAKEIVRAFDRAEQAVAAATDGRTGRVSIGFGGPASHHLIGELARGVRRRHPGIELDLTSVLYGTEATDQILRGELDMAIVRTRGPVPGLESRVIQSERYVVAVPAGHWITEMPQVDMADLADEPWITLPAASGSLVRAALLEKASEAGFSPRIVQQALDSWTIMALVGAGVGITLTIDTALPAIVDDSVLIVPLRGSDQLTYASLVWRTDNRNPALARVIEIAEALFGTTARG
ncbi:LysR family transcriptional regulator [Kribbia dieselivorans]|uniref:LysR family transcriptional regulator n=1 Tax=Kribbia dieselivorans TaxID=331526 RepID=UPI000837A959|nr:LysR substrate-binding domain-containing protein [Kribbia dieselivorans]